MNSSNNPEKNEFFRITDSRKRPSLKRKFSRWITDYKWLIIALMWVITVTLGFTGYSKHFFASGDPGAIWDALYNTLRLFTLTFLPVPGPLNTELQIARFLAPALSLFTAFQAAADIFRDQFQRLKTRFLSDHVIICGLGQKGELLTSEYRATGSQVVIIESDPQNKSIQNCKERGAIVIIGNAADPDILRKARIHMADCLFCTTGDDGINAEIAIYAREIASGNKGRALSCLAHIVDLQLWSVLREYEIRMGKLDRFRLNFFNIYESGARTLLYKHPPFTTEKVQEQGYHIVVIGIGRMGESLIINAAKKWKYSGNTGNRLRITLIDKEAHIKKESIYLRYPRLEQTCELIPLDMDFNSPVFEKGDFLFDQKGKCGAGIIYICPANEEISITSALKLQKRLYPLEIPIVVRTESDEGLATILKIPEQKKITGNIYAFPFLQNTCIPEMVWGGCTFEILARAIHEDYILNAEKRGETAQTNPSIVPLEDLPESLKESNRNQAEHISSKLESIGYDFTISTEWEPAPVQFTEAEIYKLAKMEHERFVAERLRQGWKAGSAKDDKRKISSTLIPWEELSEVEKDKDRNTVKEIPEFLAKAGYQVFQLKRNV